jgi:hypothetical protein
MMPIAGLLRRSAKVKWKSDVCREAARQTVSQRRSRAHYTTKLIKSQEKFSQKKATFVAFLRLSV